MGLSRYLVRMLIFLLVVAGMLAPLLERIAEAFMSNPALNGVIAGVLLLGVFESFRQVWALRPDMRWLHGLQSSHRPVVEQKPRLLAPLANMLANKRSKSLGLSAVSLRSLLDGTASRLQENREFSRYMIGLLIFLGLLGTFWGLLTTVGAVADVVGALNIVGDDVGAAFEDLRDGIEQPLGGMEVAFSSSLFGLAGSLVLGFLDLQAAQAQNRFYTDLEDWLSSEAQVGGAGAGGSLLEGGEGASSAYLQALMEQTAENLETLQQVFQKGEDQRKSANAALMDLTDKIARLTDQMKSEQNILLKIGESQMQMKPVLGRLADGVESGRFGIDENTQQHIRNIDTLLQYVRQELMEGREAATQELRKEIRVLTRTIEKLSEEQQ